jgi:hypothetical protein
MILATTTILALSTSGTRVVKVVDPLTFSVQVPKGFGVYDDQGLGHKLRICLIPKGSDYETADRWIIVTPIAVHPDTKELPRHIKMWLSGDRKAHRWVEKMHPTPNLYWAGRSLDQRIQAVLIKRDGWFWVIYGQASRKEQMLKFSDQIINTSSSFMMKYSPLHNHSDSDVKEGPTAAPADGNR